MDKKILFSRMKRSSFFIIGVCGIVFILFACFVAPLLLPWDPLKSDIIHRFVPPEGLSKGLSGHIFGTDNLGRDLLTRLLIGGQYSISLALVVVIINMVVGTVLGIISGYFGGWIDVAVMRVCDVMMALPTLIMGIAIISIFGQSTFNLILVLTVFSGWIQICKVTRNNVRVAKNMEFVLASNALGARPLHIMFSQILPNVTTNIIILGSQRIGVVILLEAALSFLGLGIKPPAPSWGNMISAGRQFLTTQPWMIIVPGCALMISVLSCNFLGDGVRDILDTKRRI